MIGTLLMKNETEFIITSLNQFVLEEIEFRKIELILNICFLETRVSYPCNAINIFYL